MRIQNVLGTPPFIMLGIAISRLLPPRPVYYLAHLIARSAARRRNNLFSTIRANLAQVVGPGTSEGELDRLAEEAIEHTGRTYFDMFRLSMEDYRRGRVEIRMDQEAWHRVQAAFRDPRGTVLVGPHVSNFDLAAQWFAAQGHDIQALSLVDPNSGTQVVNALRERRGLTMTPISVPSLRLAIRSLKAGGIILTGVDRPMSDQDPLIDFFGAPAHMPIGHIRLALQTGSRLVVAACTQDPDGVYRVHLAGPLEMERTGSREHDLAHNTSRVLRIIEEIIRKVPQQWLMFWPVWPHNREDGGQGRKAPSE